MRYLIGLFTLFVWLGTANALTPLPDTSSGFFSGEWGGTGAHGAYCYLSMSSNGQGVVIIDNGSGDWLGARFNWRNRQQSLEVQEITPLPISHQLRVMPLEHFTVSTGFNQSLTLHWSKHSTECYLQKTETTVNHLARARKTIKKLQPVKKAPNDH